MRMPVKYGEDRDQQGRKPNRRTQRQRNDYAEREYRHGNAEFDRRQRHAEDRRHAGPRHHHGKNDRQDNEQGASEDRTPNADSYHRKQMIGPCKWVQGAGDNPAAQTLRLVSQRWCRTNCERERARNTRPDQHT